MIDVHSHSNNSPDGNDSVEMMCDRANELGLLAYCITDHFEANFECENSAFTPKDFAGKDCNPINCIKRSCDELAIYKQRNTKTKILTGIELGQPLQDIEKTHRVLTENTFDYVLFSLHAVKGETDFYWIDYSKTDFDEIKRLFDKYYLELLEMVKMDLYDSVGHLTYPLRYPVTNGYGDKVSLTNQEDIIESVLKTVVAKDKAIEINTSGLRNKMNECLPNERYLRMYKELGGINLTIGSDAHDVNNLGKGINDAICLAKNVGFKYITYYENHMPVMVKI